MGGINFPLKFLEAAQCNLYLIKSRSIAATASWESIPERKCEKGREEGPGKAGVCTRTPCPRSGA